MPIAVADVIKPDQCFLQKLWLQIVYFSIFLLIKYSDTISRVVVSSGAVGIIIVVPIVGITVAVGISRSIWIRVVSVTVTRIPLSLSRIASLITVAILISITVRAISRRGSIISPVAVPPGVFVPDPVVHRLLILVLTDPHGRPQLALVDISPFEGVDRLLVVCPPLHIQILVVHHETVHRVSYIIGQFLCNSIISEGGYSHLRSSTNVIHEVGNYMAEIISKGDSTKGEESHSQQLLHL